MNSTNVVGKRKFKVLVLILFLLIFIQSGYAAYDVTTIEENDADAENTSVFSGNPIFGTNYTFTKFYDKDCEFIDENSTLRIRWNYDFSTDYNKTQPAEIKVVIYDIDFNEIINLSIFNYVSLNWNYLNSTPSIGTQNLSHTITWKEKNLTQYVNSSNGQMKILIEDVNSSGLLNSLSIDYLAINVTISPFRSTWMNLSNTTTNNLPNGMNYSRVVIINTSAKWNASSMSVVDAIILINDSVTGIEQEYNISNAPGFPGVSGNWTNYTLNFTNTTIFKVGGNYSVKFRAWDTFYQQNTTKTESWFYLWSNGSVTGITSNKANNHIFVNETVKFYCKVVDYYSQYNINRYNVTFYNGTNLIGTNITNSTGYAVYNYTEKFSTSDNYSISCNITDDPEIYYYSSSNDSKSLILEVIDDPYPPVINSVYFQYQDVITNMTNLYKNLTVYVNISENITSIKNVTIEVDYPNGTVLTGNMSLNSTDIWKFTFNTTNVDIPINVIGNYSINITAYDIADNHIFADYTNMANMNFTAYDSYNITLEYFVDNSTLYNRGEGLVLYARDVNGLIMHGLNWSVDLTKYNESKQSLSNWSETNNYTYDINSTDPIGNWTIDVLEVTDSIGGWNNDSKTFIFNVTDVLIPYFYYESYSKRLYENRVYSPSNEIHASTPLKIRINFSRGMTANYTMQANLSDIDEKNHTVGRVNDTPTYFNSSIEITAPGTYSTSFSLCIYVNDSANNNSGKSCVTMKTDAEPDPGSPRRRSSIIITPVTCNCTEWVNVGCGSGNCTDRQMYQSRTCTPSACEVEAQCVDNYPLCAENLDFTLSLGNEALNIIQGETKKVAVVVENNGNVPLDLTILTTSTCSILEIMNSFNLNVDDSLNTFLTVSVPLNSTLGECPVNIEVSSARGTQSKGLVLTILESEVISDFDDYSSRLAILEEAISELAASGVDTSTLETIKLNALEAMKGALVNIGENDQENASIYLIEMQKSLDSLETSIPTLYIWKNILDYRWHLLGIALLLIVTTYLFVHVFLPPWLVSHRIDALKKKEKMLVQTRINTEKQYFLRRIDEKTFNSIMAKITEDINKTKSKLRDRVKQENMMIEKKKTKKVVNKAKTVIMKKNSGKK